MTAVPIVETKRTLDGRVQTFHCAGLLVTARLAVVRFDHSAARSVAGFFFPEGSYTVGYFWRTRPYNCYRFTSPSGEAIAYRFDVVDRVRIQDHAVGFRDLLLDIWVDPAGHARVEDEDEVAAARAAGLLRERDLARIERSRRLIFRDHPRIIAECEAILEAMSDER
jgi:predicted RNA-binding protein associated with RNAse of E/G family